MDRAAQRTILTAVTVAVLAGCGGSTAENGGEPPATDADGGGVPAACLDALDQAENVMVIAADGMGVAGDMMAAAADFDVDAILEASDELNGLTPQVNAVGDGYRDARDECRSVGGGVPAACLDALDQADNIMVIAADGMGVAGDMMAAAADFDVDAILEASDELNGLTPQVNAVGDDYRDARDECRDAA